MKRQHINYLIVGLVSIALFGLLIVVLFKITGRTGPTDPYYINYASVPGLEYGTPLYYEGYLVGQVESVTPDRSGQVTRFRVDVSVQQGWDIPVDSQAEISTGLLSGVAIDIEEGLSDEVLSPGSEIPGTDTVNFMIALNDLASDMRELSTTHIRPMVERLSQRVDSISEGLGDDVPELIVDVQGLVQSLDRSARRLEQVLSDDNRTRVGSTIVNLQDVSEKLLNVAEDMSVAGTEIRTMINENRPDVDDAVEEMRLVFEILAQRLDSVGYQMEAAGRNLNEFTRQIRNNPSLLISSQPKDEPEESP